MNAEDYPGKITDESLADFISVCYEEQYAAEEELLHYQDQSRQNVKFVTAIIERQGLKVPQSLKQGFSESELLDFISCGDGDEYYAMGWNIATMAAVISNQDSGNLELLKQSKDYLIEAVFMSDSEEFPAWLAAAEELTGDYWELTCLSPDEAIDELYLLVELARARIALMAQQDVNVHALKRDVIKDLVIGAIGNHDDLDLVTTTLVAAAQNYVLTGEIKPIDYGLHHIMSDGLFTDYVKIIARLYRNKVLGQTISSQEYEEDQ